MTRRWRQVYVADPREATALGIAAIYQELSLFPDLNVAENIFVGRQPTKAGGRLDWRTLYAEADSCWPRWAYTWT